MEMMIEPVMLVIEEITRIIIEAGVGAADIMIKTKYIRDINYDERINNKNRSEQQKVK